MVFLGVKGSGREAGRSSPFSVVFKSEWSYTSTLQYVMSLRHAQESYFSVNSQYQIF